MLKKVVIGTFLVNLVSCRETFSISGSGEPLVNLNNLKGLITDKNGYEIQFFLHPKTWLEADKHCKDLGGELALIEYPEKNYELQYWLDRLTNWKQRVMWLGYSDVREEGVFVDNNYNAPAEYFWRDGEPNNIGIEPFVELGTHKIPLIWNNNSGTSKRPYACQFINSL